MVRELACFSSTTIGMVFASCDVVVIAFVTTCAYPFLPVAASRSVRLTCWICSCQRGLGRRGVRFLRRFCSVFAFLSAFSCAFCARASGSCHTADDGVSKRASVAARAFSCFRHLCASDIFLRRSGDGWCSEAWLICLQGGFVLFVLVVLEVICNHLLQALI